jgi:tetratricopeptide (TPR) repeat protein
LPRRATLRPEIRTALALEEAGELQEAARVFEYAGEHAQAAVLRLEHARTLRDPADRLDVLREGCARNPGTTAEGRTLHLALAESLLAEADTTKDSARRRALELEAAAALEEADEGGRAGELYESLGLLQRAARAYEKAGEVARLELVLEVIERHEQAAAARKGIEREVDEAIATGQRRYAFELLSEHVYGGARPSSVAEPGTTALALAGRLDRRPPPGLVQRLQLLESRRPRRDRIDLRWNEANVLAVRGAPKFRIGRSPEAELSLPGARLSRMHVELSLDNTRDATRLIATDLGSKVGTFWNGDPLLPGEPFALEEPGELGLGLAATVEVHPMRGTHGEVVAAMVKSSSAQQWMLFLPLGGPLWLAPDIRVPGRLLFDRDFVILDLASGVVASLGETALPAGEAIELMLGDRIRLRDAPLRIEVLA